MKHFLILSAIAALFLFGCSEKKVDAEKLNKANELVNAGKYEEGLTQLDAMAKESPNDAALKQSLVLGHLKYANFFMYNDSLPPKVKYPGALKQYRAVLKVDPTNENAKQSSEMIINIYHSMGREVPAEN
jgi:tetratricopeptide (TPR) repeat protein